MMKDKIQYDGKMLKYQKKKQEIYDKVIEEIKIIEKLVK